MYLIHAQICLYIVEHIRTDLSLARGLLAGCRVEREWVMAGLMQSRITQVLRGMRCLSSETCPLAGPPAFAFKPRQMIQCGETPGPPLNRKGHTSHLFPSLSLSIGAPRGCSHQLPALTPAFIAGWGGGEWSFTVNDSPSRTITRSLIVSIPLYKYFVYVWV